jgi:vesicle transport protein SEC22
MSNTSETRAAIESGEYKLQYAVYAPVLVFSLWSEYHSFYRHEDLIFFAITERSFPKELAAMYLDDVSAEFLSTHRDTEYRSPALRPYAFNDFDTFMQRTKKSYENPRASNNLDKVQAQLKETTQIMSKNLEDLLYRGDSLDRMGQMSSDLRESSKKYKRAAVRINWELLLKQVRRSSNSVLASAYWLIQYGPFAALGAIILFFIIWRFWWTVPTAVFWWVDAFDDPAKRMHARRW